MALGLGMTVRLGGNNCINGITQACVWSQYLETLEGIHTFCDPGIFHPKCHRMGEGDWANI